jgi:hypothetical protein
LSVGSNASSSNGEHRFAREVSETFSMKLREMKWCLLALISNILMIILVQAMVSGVVIGASKELVQTLEGIVLEILLLVSNIFTIMAMDSGLSAFFGFQMGTRGRSMAVIGFSQSTSIFKWSFANDLSLNSTVRKILNRLAVVWAITEFLKLITPIGASALHSDIVRVDEGTVNCILFTQNGHPVDRKWPNVRTELGFAELIFGKSIGKLRSEEAVDITTAIIGPQLTGVVSDGDTIVGDGFLIDILTNCRCSVDDTVDSLKAVGVPDAQAASFRAEITGSDRRNWYLVNHLAHNGTDAMIVYSAVLNTALCGGYETTSTPICITDFSNHKKATIMMEYMTDGTTASIAQKFAFIRDIGDAANVDVWAFDALQNILGSGVTKFPMPSQVPGTLTSLMWWTSTDLMCIDPALLEAGLETLFTMLFRAGIQRTYNTDGATCVRNVIDESQTILYMYSYGVDSSLAALIIQLIFNGMAAVAYIPWLFSNIPVGPAIRAMNESIYFTALLADSNLSDNLKGLCNAPTHAIWQSLDIVVRIGESIMTQDEAVGHITMDKPKVVRPMVNARKYA